MNIIEKIFRNSIFRGKIQIPNTKKLSISFTHFQFGVMCSFDNVIEDRSLHILSVDEKKDFFQQSILKLVIFTDSKIEEHIEFDSFEEIDKYIEKWFPEINQSLKKRVLEVS